MSLMSFVNTDEKHETKNIDFERYTYVSLYTHDRRPMVDVVPHDVEGLVGVQPLGDGGHLAGGEDAAVQISAHGSSVWQAG